MIPVQNLFYLLCYAWDEVGELESAEARQLDRFDRLEDLFGWVLARSVIRLSRRGLDRSYVPFQEELAGVRGKIELNETVRSNTLIRNRLACSFEDLSTDVLHNQILASTLAMLSRTPTLDPRVRGEVRRALPRMSGVTERPLSLRMFSRIQLDRNRRRYRFPIHVCRLLLQARIVDPVAGKTRFLAVGPEDLKMWRVFERFAARFYERETSYRVRPQTHLAWWALEPVGPASEGRIPRMEPDLLLTNVDRRIILDTKYYKDGGLGDEDAAKLRAGHLYQMFAYVMNRERAQPDGPQHEGILLYPTVGRETRVEFRTHGHRFQARSVDLGRPWREVHAGMVGVLG